MATLTLREIFESTPEGTEGRDIVLEVFGAENAPGPMESMPVDVPDDAGPEGKIREGLLAALGAFAAQADAGTLRQMLAVVGMPDSISEIVGGGGAGADAGMEADQMSFDDHAPDTGGAVEEAEAPPPPDAGAPPPASDDGGAGGQSDMPPAPAQESEAEEGDEPPMKPEDQETPEDEAAETPEQQAEEDEEGTEQHGKDDKGGKKQPQWLKKKADESRAISADVVLECIGIFAEKGIKASRQVIEAAARLTTKQAREQFADEVVRLTAENAAPAPLATPRSAPGRVAESAATKTKTLEEIEADYRKPGSLRGK